MKSVQEIYNAKLSQVNSIISNKLGFLRSAQGFDSMLTRAKSSGEQSIETQDTLTSKTAVADAISLFNPDGAYDSTALIEAYLKSAYSSNNNIYNSNSSSLSPTQYDELIESAAQKAGISSALLKGLIKAESNFNSSAVSPAGAQGLTQLMPATAKALGVTDSFDPKQNVEAGATYLKKQIDRCNGDVRMALAAYNAGYYRLKELGIQSSNSLEYSLLSNETRAYVERVLQYGGLTGNTVG